MIAAQILVKIRCQDRHALWATLALIPVA